MEFLTILMRLICIQLRLSRAVTSWISVDFVYKQLLDGHKPCNTTLSLTQYAFSEISLETRIKLYSLVTVKTKENSIRYSNVFLMNTRASLLATVSHHIMHYSIIFWIRGLSCNLCFQRISEKEYIKDKS